ncbi:hypothetical protein GCM10007387_22010 [Pseudoduganella albidiflava]|uniref:Uncharacterized protein n=1 Tax=Pseudoduganella albidiflava TaxID=321983 RepID=A0AA87XWX2_9BURK|nr:hypothetical protein GCM10007387_22010 [Pseudoduganella albidiflava]
MDQLFAADHVDRRRAVRHRARFAADPGRHHHVLDLAKVLRPRRAATGQPGGKQGKVKGGLLVGSMHALFLF